MLGGITSGQGGSCDILNFTLGSQNLNLLGVDVAMDNCANGAVAVNLTGHGGPLGQLLCGLLRSGIPLGTTLGGVLGGITGL